MRFRTVSVIAVLVLVVAACTSDTTTDGDVPATTVSEAPEAVVLSYSLQPGSSFTYEVGLDQRIELTSEGNDDALGEDEVPGEMSVELTGTTTFTHTVAEGPEPGTYEVNIVGDFSDLSVQGTVDGEPVEDEEIPDIAEMDPIDVTIVVDEQGNPISDNERLDELFGGGLGALEGFGNLATPGLELGQFIGPPLADEPVTVGDTWSETIETPMLMGDEEDAITTEITNEVTGTDNVDGVDVLVIDTESVTSAIQFDLAEFLIGFFGAFIPEDAPEEDTAELGSLMEDLRFVFDIDETTANMTTLFDPDDGVAREAELESLTHMVMDINVPDESTGEMMMFMLDMTIDQAATYRLIESTTA